ncbi:hypothetical protein [uncultured Paludibaculum sp.]|uniref:hypothetical protein n=1 Tax=uncultured Paludibaculum sp. TaxID=1765020 RepID=UPI002AAB6188|nr:hypothetical protein [uncultured Paludibaculum sp.]
MTRLWRSPLVLACAAVLLALSWQATKVHALHHGQWTALFYTSSTAPVPPDLRPGTAVFPPGSDYDGQFYRYIAHDLWPPFEYSAYVDAPFNRYTRVLFPALGRLLALGNPGWVDQGIIAAVLLTVFCGVFWSAQFFLLRNRAAAWGLLFLVLPATISSVDRLITDSLLAALTVAFLRFSSARALWPVAAAAALTREYGAVIAAALAFSTRRVVLYLTAAAPAVSWWILVWKYCPPGQPAREFGFLPLALIHRIATPRAPWLLAVLDLMAITGLVVCLVLVARWAWPHRTEAAPLAVLLWSVLAMVTGGPNIMYEPFSWARVFSPLFCWVLYESILRRTATGVVAVLAVAATPLAIDAKALLIAIGLLGS